MLLHVSELVNNKDYSMNFERGYTHHLLLPVTHAGQNAEKEGQISPEAEYERAEGVRENLRR